MADLTLTFDRSNTIFNRYTSVIPINIKKYLENQRRKRTISFRRPPFPVVVHHVCLGKERLRNGLLVCRLVS